MQKYPLYRLIAIVWKSSPLWSSVYLCLLVVLGLLPLVQFYIIKILIDTVANGIKSPGMSQFIDNVFYPLLFLSVIQLLSTIISRIGSEMQSIQMQYFSDYIHNIIHDKSVNIDLEYYENTDYNNTLHRAQQEASYRPQRLINDLSSIVQNGFSVVAVSGMLFFAHWSIVVLIIVAVLPEIFISLKLSRVLYAWTRKRTTLNRLAYYYSWMMTRHSFAKEIRLFGLGDLFIDRYKELMKSLRKEKTAMTMKNTLVAIPGQVLGGAAMLGAFSIIAFLTVTGKQTIGGFVMYFQACRRGFETLKQLQSALTDLYENNLFLSNLFEYLDLPLKLTDVIDAKNLPAQINKGITIENLTFTYPNSDTLVLDNINLEIHHGEIVAIAGRNGSGKTTLIKLLCRMYDPENGSIKIDDCDIRKYKVSSLRQEMSILFQDWAKYQFTANESIWFGDCTQILQPEKIRESATIVNADKFISDLPIGYDTKLGNWFDNSVELSNGEWQKIALARTLYRNAQIVILDEPTSSFDIESEKITIDNLRRFAKDRITIVVSHRLSTLMMADRIIVLDKGRVTQQGTFADLIQVKGSYLQIVSSQLENCNHNQTI